MLNKISAFFVLLLLSSISQAQLIRVHEKDLDDHSYSNIKFADINSRIQLELDAATLSKRIQAGGIAPFPADVSRLLTILNQALAKKNDMLDRFNAAMQQRRTEKDVATAAANAAAFNKEIQSIAQDIVALFDQDPTLEMYYAEEPSLRLIAPLYPALERRIKDIERSLFTADSPTDVRIQLGGWMVHKGISTPLHFAGLDDNPLGEFYELDRWKFMPTPEQLKELSQLQEMAKNSAVKEAGLKDILFDTYLREFGDALKNKLEATAEAFETEAQAIIASNPGSNVIADLREILAETSQLRSLFKEKIAYYSNLKSSASFSLADLLVTIGNDITTVSSTQQTVKQLLQQLKTDVAAASSTVQALCKQLLVLAEHKLKALASSFISPAALDGLASTDRIDALALAFSEKVFSLSLKDLPTDMSTDLRYAGQRDIGDRVEIRLVVTNGAEKKMVFQESRDITLYRIIPHLEGTVGVIFAHPLKPTSIQKEFQMAPYYNLLFKGVLGMSRDWKRKSAMANTLLDFNFGLHLSSPDFNKDDVPELGVGLVASTLNDYVQFGWAYNVFEAKPYLFFGIRLPVPSMNFGGNGQSAAAIDR